MPKTLVIIVSYNGLNHIKECLNNSFISSESFDFMIIDNGSTDETIKHVKENYPSIKVIENGKNIGFGAANNIGLKYALEKDYEYVYLLNQDAWIKPESLFKLLNIAEKNKSFGIISPLHVYADEKRIDLNFSSNISKEIKDVYIINKGEKKDIYSLTNKTLQAAHWLVPVSAIRKVGGFSPTFFMYGEDTNLCQRMEYYGYRLGIVPEVLAVHNRENRVEPPSYKFILSTNCWRESISNPLISKSRAKRRLLEKMSQTLIYFPRYFLPAFMEFLKDLRKIKGNRRISMTKDCAFL